MASKRVWSTDAVPAGQRLDFWISAICEAFLEQHAWTGNAEKFEAHLESATVGAIVVNCVTAAPQSVFRRKGNIARSSENYYYLLTSATSTWRASQDETQARLLPGDMVLLDSRRCYELHFPESYSNLAVQLPIDWLETWLPEPQRLLGRRFDGKHGWGETLSSLLRQLTPDGVGDLALPGQIVADQVGALLSLASHRLAPIDARPKRHDVLVKRIQEEIRSRCTEPGLAAGLIASEIGMSVRTLHRHLAAADMTFAGVLMAERMAMAHRMLATPAFAGLNIGEIGYRVGLMDPSHFSRAYKRHWGVNPAQARTGV